MLLLYANKTIYGGKFMARYTGPQWKISRRLGFSILENGKELNRRAYAPGQHGQKRKKQTEYGLQLAEKQKVRHMYGVNEKQFHNTFNQAGKMEGIHGYNFLCLLERRLDNVVYRLGFASTRRHAQSPEPLYARRRAPQHRTAHLRADPARGFRREPDRRFPALFAADDL